MKMVNLRNLSKRLITLNNVHDKKKVKYKLVPAGPAVAVDEYTAALPFTQRLIQAGDLQMTGQAEAIADDDDGDPDPDGEGDGSGDPDPDADNGGGSDDALEGLRREYEDLAGKAADKRWGEDKLTAEIEKLIEG